MLASSLLAVSLAAAPPPAALCFEQVVTSFVNGRQRGPEQRLRVCHAGPRMRVEPSDAAAGPTLILRLDRNEAWQLDPERRVARRLDVEALRARSHLDLATAGELLGADEEGGVRSEPLAGTRTIAGHVCRGWRLRSGSTRLELQLATDLPIGVDAFAQLLEWTGASQSLGGLMSELRRLPGFPLETRSRTTVLADTIETLASVTRVEAGPLDDALFEPPPGYAIEEEREEP